MKHFYDYSEFRYYEMFRTPRDFPLLTLGKLLITFQFFAGFALLLPLIMLRRVLMDHRVRLLVICTLVLTAGMLCEIFLFPHYLAPFTSVFYALGLQAMRHLRVWKVEGQPVGYGLVRLLVTVCVVLAVLRTFDGPLHIRGASLPGTDWRAEWYGPGQFGAERAQMKARLEKMPRGQLAIVKYSMTHDPLDEWVYNAADIDHAKVIWARDMGEAGNRELIDYYKDRTVWLVEPDTEPATVSPYMDRKPGSREIAVLPAR